MTGPSAVGYDCLRWGVRVHCGVITPSTMSRQPYSALLMHAGMSAEKRAYWTKKSSLLIGWYDFNLIWNGLMRGEKGGVAKTVNSKIQALKTVNSKKFCLKTINSKNYDFSSFSLFRIISTAQSVLWALVLQIGRQLIKSINFLVLGHNLLEFECTVE